MLSIWFNKISEIFFIGFGFVIFATLIGGFVISPVIVAIVSFNSKKPFRDVMNEMAKGNSYIMHISVIFALIIEIIFTVIIFYGNTDIKSIFKRSNFNLEGYVYAFPNSHNAKSYRLKADLTSNNILFYQKFWVDKIYFNNGGYIDFTNQEYYEDKESLDDKGTLACGYYEDNNDDKNWCFRFYGEQIKEKK